MYYSVIYWLEFKFKLELNFVNLDLDINIIFNQLNVLPKKSSSIDFNLHFQKFLRYSLAIFAESNIYRWKHICREDRSRFLGNHVFHGIVQFRLWDSLHFAWCIKSYLRDCHLLFNNRATLKATTRVRLLKLIATPKSAILSITLPCLMDVIPFFYLQKFFQLQGRFIHISVHVISPYFEEIRREHVKTRLTRFLYKLE